MSLQQTSTHAVAVQSSTAQLNTGIINCTLVDVPLTAILVGLFAASSAPLQSLFVAAPGQALGAAIVIATLLLATTFTLIKNLPQSSVDKRFKQAHGSARKLKLFDWHMKALEEVTDARQITPRPLDAVRGALDAGLGATYLQRGGEKKLIHAAANVLSIVKLNVPMVTGDEQIGLLELGSRPSNRDHSAEDEKLLCEVVNQAAHLVPLTERGKENQHQ